MKTLMSLVVLSAGLNLSAQDVFVLGGPGSSPVPPIVYQPPLVGGAQTYQAIQPTIAAIPVAAVPVQPVVAAIPVQPVVAAVPVTPVYATPAYSPPCYSYSGYSGYYNYDPNVIYIGGPGSCGPNYYDYGRCSTPNVIYFGREQAHRQGYNFRHCR